MKIALYSINIGGMSELSPLKRAQLERKQEKIRHEVRDLFRRQKDGGFSYFKNKPTEEETVAMVRASKFGPGDPLNVNHDFGAEYIFDDLGSSIKAAQQQQAIEYAGSIVLDENAKDICFVQYRDEPWANLIFLFDVDEVILPFLPSNYSTDDFYFDQTLDLNVDIASRQIGITLSIETFIPFADAVATYYAGQEPPKFTPSRYKSNDHVTIYHIHIATIDRLVDAERDKHGVKGHERKLQSGKVVFVREHDRHNPVVVGARKINLSEVNHVVYRALDVDGNLRYIGEGKEQRPNHVNSGVSHNFKLNEHYFKRGPMNVEVIKNGLNKQEALAIEQLLIRRHAGPNLWNIKDNEPDVDQGTENQAQ